MKVIHVIGLTYRFAEFFFTEIRFLGFHVSRHTIFIHASQHYLRHNRLNCFLSSRLFLIIFNIEWQNMSSPFDVGSFMDVVSYFYFFSRNLSQFHNF